MAIRSHVNYQSVVYNASPERTEGKQAKSISTFLESLRHVPFPRRRDCQPHRKQKDVQRFVATEAIASVPINGVTSNEETIIVTLYCNMNTLRELSVDLVQGKAMLCLGLLGRDVEWWHISGGGWCSQHPRYLYPGLCVSLGSRQRPSHAPLCSWPCPLDSTVVWRADHALCFC